MRLLDRQAVELLTTAVEDIKSGSLAVERYKVSDGDSLSVSFVLVAGPRALAMAREQQLADAGMDSVARPRGPTAYRSPTELDSCPACGRMGGMREAGALAWLCIACNAETSPFGEGG